MIDDDEVYGLHCDIGRLEVENAKLRKLVANMANALGIDREWCDTSWCDLDASQCTAVVRFAIQHGKSYVS